MNLCLESVASIPERKKLLAAKRDLLLKKINEIHESIDFIDNKQAYFDGVLTGETEYSSNLIAVDK